MTLSPNLEARAVGVEAIYKDPRSGSARALPQRVAIFAQGETGVSFSTDKFAPLSAAEVGAKLGYRSVAYAVARELFPANGDGILVPATFFPLEDADNGDPAVGAVVASGTATRSFQARVNVSEVRSEPFVVAKDASVTANHIAAYDAFLATLGMPGWLRFTYGSATSAPDAGNTGNGTMGAITVTAASQPRPGVYSLVCTAEATNAGTFAVTDPDGVALPNLTVGVAYVSGTGLAFTLADGVNDFDVDDSLTITVPASGLAFTSGWAGASANDLSIVIEGDTTAGVTWAVTQPSGGLVNPDVTDALAQIGTSWESMALNALNIEDTDTLDIFQEWGEGRWLPTVKRPLVVFVGQLPTTVAGAITITDARKDDRINSAIPLPASHELPAVVAARALVRIANLADANPPTDYAMRKLDGLVPGADGAQWNLGQRDAAIKGGCSTIEVVDGVARLSNVVTMYHPTGELPPPYRYVVDIVKLQTCIYSLEQAFSTEEWAGAPLIKSGQASTNPNAKSDVMAKAVAANVVTDLALLAIIADPKWSIARITADIDATNPKRLNVRVPVKLAGNTNIIDATLEWSFFFG